MMKALLFPGGVKSVDLFLVFLLHKLFLHGRVAGLMHNPQPGGAGCCFCQDPLQQVSLDLPGTQGSDYHSSGVTRTTKHICHNKAQHPGEHHREIHVNYLYFKPVHINEG